MQFAQVEWREDAQGKRVPYSRDFDDIYFSTDDGLQESQYVFVQHNQLAARFAAATHDFYIGELGFGTGLNFCCVAQAWQQYAPKQFNLHYLGIEQFPLQATDFKQSLQCWPNFSAFENALSSQYLTLLNCQKIVILPNVFLTLHTQDALTSLKQQTQAMHAWLLDGYAPAKNPAIWQTDCYFEMARLSEIGSTFATFTSAGHVRRGLQAAGFQVQKSAGFGRKREMLWGQYAAI